MACNFWMWNSNSTGPHGTILVSLYYFYSYSVGRSLLNLAHYTHARLASTVSIYIVYYRDWRRSIGSVLKILFFYWCMALRPKYAELNLWGVLNVLTFGCQDEVEFKW